MALCVFVATVCCAMVGCRNMFWWNRGPVEAQRQWSQAFDPFPDPDIGPEVVGARPEEFAEPIAEPLRSRVWGTQNRAPGRGF